MPDLENFPDPLYESDRSAAKAHASYPLTQEYIERLEVVAKAANMFLAHAYSPNGKEHIAKRNELNDALAMINFLDETM